MTARQLFRLEHYKEIEQQVFQRVITKISKSETGDGEKSVTEITINFNEQSELIPYTISANEYIESWGGDVECGYFDTSNKELGCINITQGLQNAINKRLEELATGYKFKPLIK